MRSALLGLLALWAAGCFSPRIERCAVECGAGSACPPGTTCLADGMCHADPGDALCSIVPGDDGGPDGGGPGHDGGPDASWADAATPVTPTEPGQLVISELLINPEAFDELPREWFEVMNPSPDTWYDLQGLEVWGEQVTEEFTIDQPVLLGPGERALFARSGDALLNGGLAPRFVYGDALELGNTSGEVALIHPFGPVVIDRVTYGTSWPRSEGRSTSLDPAQHDAQANDDPARWCSGVDAYTAAPPHEHGTPGEPNPACP